MRYSPVVFVLCCTLFSGCASLRVPPDDVYPFRAAFTGSALIGGEKTDFNGALAITSREQGFAQIYGPGGLAAYSIHVTQGEVKVSDMWGRAVRNYTVPLDQFLGLVAGVPPSMRYLWSRSLDGRKLVTYTWGTLMIDENLLPLELHIKGDPSMDVQFIRGKNTMTLLMNLGSDTLRLALDVIEGGRWMRQPFMD